MIETIIKGITYGVLISIAFLAVYIAFGPPVSCCKTQDAGQVATAPMDDADIRVASDDSRMPAILAGVNNITSEHGIHFTQVSRNAPAEIVVDFVRSIGPAHIGGGATAGADTSGNYVRIVDAALSRRLVVNALHEFVHVAGYVRHDSDPASLMHPIAGSQIRPEHVAALRSLAGGGGLFGIW